MRLGLPVLLAVDAVQRRLRDARPDAQRPALAVRRLRACRLLPIRLRWVSVTDEEEIHPEPDATSTYQRAPTVWAVALVAAASLMFWLRPGVKVVWWSAVIFLAVALWLVLRESPRMVPAAAGRKLERWLWLLGLTCVVIALISHRPDADDAHYLAMAIAAVDLPQWSLMSTDTLHGIPNLPLLQPIYRCHSFELFNGALSYLTGIPVIYCVHLVTASLAALLLPLAWARLFRILTPSRWLPAVAVFVFVLLAVGETHRWYGNFAIVRMWQGKALFLFVFMPLVYTYALRFGLRPNRRDWILLCAAQVAAMGSSSSALWCAPFGAAIAFASVWRPSRKSLPALVLTGLASSVLVVVGLALKDDMMPYTERIARQDASLEASRLTSALEVVLSDGRLMGFSLVCCLVAWLLCRQAITRRLLVCIPFGFLVFLFNPYTAKLVSIHVTGPSFWRALWAVPVPLFITFVLLAPLRLRVQRRRTAWLALAAGLLGFAAFVPRFHGLSDANGVAIHRPGLKVPPVEYDLARRLHAAVGPGASVLVGGQVNPWPTTMHHHVHPVMVRNYLSSRRIRTVLGSQDVNRRRDMTVVASGFKVRQDSLETLRLGLDLYRVEGVCFRSVQRSEMVREVLDDLGFRRVYVGEKYEIWTREL